MYVSHATYRCWPCLLNLYQTIMQIRQIVATENYGPVLTLVLYYQMEPRLTIRLKLLKVREAIYVPWLFRFFSFCKTMHMIQGPLCSLCLLLLLFLCLLFLMFLCLLFLLVSYLLLLFFSLLLFCECCCCCFGICCCFCLCLCCFVFMFVVVFVFVFLLFLC